MTKEQYVAMVEAWPRKEILKLFRAARITAHAIKTNRELAERLWLRIGQYRHKETRANPMRYKMIDRAAPKRNPLSKRDSLIRLARLSADEYAYAKGHYATMPHEKRGDRRKTSWVKMQDLYREVRSRKGAMVRARRLAREMHRAVMQHDVDRGDFDPKDVKLVEMLKRGGYLRNPLRQHWEPKEPLMLRGETYSDNRQNRKFISAWQQFFWRNKTRADIRGDGVDTWEVTLDSRRLAREGLRKLRAWYPKVRKNPRNTSTFFGPGYFGQHVENNGRHYVHVSTPYGKAHLVRMVGFTESAWKRLGKIGTTKDGSPIYSYIARSK
jgi:hypothetical protein